MRNFSTNTFNIVSLHNSAGRASLYQYRILHPHQNLFHARLAVKKQVELASVSSPRRTNVRPQRSGTNYNIIAISFNLLSTSFSLLGSLRSSESELKLDNPVFTARRVRQRFYKQFQSCFTRLILPIASAVSRFPDPTIFSWSGKPGAVWIPAKSTGRWWNNPGHRG